jgi:magnesium transporter
MTLPDPPVPGNEEEEDGEGLELPTRFRRGRPGQRPGIDAAQLESMPAPAERVPITCIDFAPDRVETHRITDFEAFIRSPRAKWIQVRWINVDGLSDPGAIRALAIKYGLHPLAIEDVMNVGQRPKLDPYPADGDRPAHIFEIIRMIQHTEGGLESEQLSMFVGRNFVITIQESPGDIWDPIRQRLEKPGSRLRTLDASYLAYALIDAIVDHCFPVLEHYGDRLEELEDLVLERPDRETIQEIHALKRELLLLRRAVWPMREVVNAMQREPHECMSEITRTYLRDVYDHLIQIMDIIETYREVGTSLTETYMTSMSNRMSEVMKVLTIIGTIFIPLTFLAGVYGMNMRIPENQWVGSYPIFWAVCIVLAGGMVVWFRKRGWL